jgi:hypothetical protein
MRAGLRLGLAAAGMLASSVSAAAESRVFIIANHADGYGVDRCLATGERCGVTVATAYCQSQSFALAKSFRKIEREEITGAVPAGNNVCSGSCESFVAIECSR